MKYKLLANNKIVYETNDRKEVYERFKQLQAEKYYKFLEVKSNGVCIMYLSQKNVCINSPQIKM